MQQLFKRHPELQEIMAQIINELQNATRPANEIILDDVTLREKLKVSKRTTATYRQQGLIAYSQYGNGKVFYFLSDVLEFIKKYRVDSFDSNLNIKL